MHLGKELAVRAVTKERMLMHNIFSLDLILQVGNPVDYFMVDYLPHSNTISKIHNFRCIFSFFQLDFMAVSTVSKYSVISVFSSSFVSMSQAFL